MVGGGNSEDDCAWIRYPQLERWSSQVFAEPPLLLEPWTNVRAQKPLIARMNELTTREWLAMEESHAPSLPIESSETRRVLNDPVSRQSVGRDLVDVAYLEGDFVLSSGVKSKYYFDKYLFETKPAILRQVAFLLSEHVPADIDRLAGPELGAVALATALSLETGVPFVILRKAAKGYGSDRLIEGELCPGERVLIVEDIITTGAQAITGASKVLQMGAEVAGILAVLDREEGGAAEIAAAGFPFHALFRRSELGL